VLLLLTGCAAGAPVGFRIEAGHLRYRPATPRELPRDKSAPTVAPLAELEEEACGEDSEGTEEEEAGRVRLELETGESVVFTPGPAPAPVRVSEEALRGAWARWVLDMPLAVRSALADSSVVQVSAGDAARLDRRFQQAFQRWGVWCQPGQSPREDGCLSLLEQGFSLAEYDRVQLAASFALDTVMDGVDAAVRDTVSPKVLGAMVAGMLASYVLMLAVPEPVFTKGAALLLTAFMVAYLGTGPFWNMVGASRELVDASRRATTFAELEEAGHRFGRVIGEDGTRTVLLLLMAALGGGQGLAARGALLPGFAQAEAVALAQVGFRLSVVGEVHSITLTASGGFVLGLAPTAMAMVAQGSGGTQPPVAKKGYWHHIATNKFKKSTRNGGPWTPQFERLFARAGMKLSDAANKVFIQGHKGPHPQAYHEAVFRRLTQVMRQCRNTQQCRELLVRELQSLAEEISKVGSPLNKLLTE
jgi:hypothetical protein